MQALLLFAAALGFGFVGSIPLTGPIAVLVLSRSVAGDYRAANFIGLGAAVAEGLYAGIAYFAFSALSASELLRPIADAVTLVVLVALGAYFAQWRYHEKKSPKTHGKRAGWIGFSISIVNPTLLVTWSAVVAALIGRGFGGGGEWLAIPFGLGAAVGVGAWELLFVRFVRRFGPKFTGTTLQWVVRGVGIALVGLGAWSGWSFWHSAPPTWKQHLRHPVRELRPKKR